MSTRTRISAESTEQLKLLEKKTRLTPNILARLAIALSMEDEAPFTEPVKDHGGLEFNHSTLYGEHEVIYRHLAIQWAGTVTEPEKILSQHLERGVEKLRDLLATHTIADLADVRITPRAHARKYTRVKESVS